MVADRQNQQSGSFFIFCGLSTESFKLQVKMVIESLYRIIVACTSLFHLIDGHFNDSNADTPKVISRCQSQAVEDVCRWTEHIFGPIGAKVDRLLFLPRLMRFGITIACSTTSGPRAGCANTAYRDHGWNKALYYKLAKMSPCGSMDIDEWGSLIIFLEVTMTNL